MAQAPHHNWGNVGVGEPDPPPSLIVAEGEGTVPAANVLVFVVPLQATISTLSAMRSRIAPHFIYCENLNPVCCFHVRNFIGLLSPFDLFKKYSSRGEYTIENVMSVAICVISTIKVLSPGGEARTKNDAR